MSTFALVKREIMSPAIQNAIKEQIGSKRAVFVSSILSLIGSDSGLMECDPGLVIKEALKATALDLSLSKELGFAYVIAYKNKREGTVIPQFQLGYKGIIQLAIRSAQFKNLHAGKVTEGEHLVIDKLRGTMEITGTESGKNIGFFAYMRLNNGFEKSIFWPIADVEAFARKHSKAYKFGPWQTNFDEMAEKTMLKRLRGFMPLSLVMQDAFIADADPIDLGIAEEISENSQSEIIDVRAMPSIDPMQAKLEVTGINMASGPKIKVVDSPDDPFSVDALPADCPF